MTIMRFVAIALAIGLGSVCAASQARADNCGQALAQPEVDIQTALRPVVYDFEKGLKVFATDPDYQVSGKSADIEHTLGLTKMSMTYEWSINFDGMPRSEGGYCWSVKKLMLKISAGPTVFIGREIPRDSCAWREVMVHEMRHVKMDQQLYPLLADQVRPQILQAAMRTIASATGDQAKADFDGSIGMAVDKALESFLAKRSARQLTIDTPEEYARFGQICGEAAFIEIFTQAGLL